MIDSSVRLIESRIIIFVEAREFDYYMGMSTFDTNIARAIDRLEESENHYTIMGYNPLDHEIVCVGVYDLLAGCLKDIVICDSYMVYKDSMIMETKKYLEDKVRNKYI